jgi:23S rRNA (uracil1939-C5)-methyltransferase
MDDDEFFIESFDKLGNGVAFYKKDKKLKKVVIHHTVIGDHVKAVLRKKKKRGFFKAKLIEILKKSKYRVEPKCSHAHICGGCRWQEMSYSSQLIQKQRLIVEEFEGVISKRNVSVFDIIPARSSFGYRNKMEFSFSENRAGSKFLGLMIAEANRYVFNIERCFLCSKWFSDVLNAVRIWWESSELKAYDYSSGEGALKTLTLREGKNTNEKMVLLTVSGNSFFALNREEVKSFVDVVKNVLGEEVSIFLIIEQKAKGHPTQVFEMHLYGKDHIREGINIDGKKLFFKVSPRSFFQPNTFQAENLYLKALSLANIDENSLVYDLYCGTGVIGIIFSFYVRKVIGIEINRICVLDALENFKINGVKNFEILEGDVGKLLIEGQKADLVIVDPPRAGLDSLALHNLKILRPKSILYVSCNIKTQRENIEEFLKVGYELLYIQPVDQFPHTIHIENIALLKLT